MISHNEARKKITICIDKGHNVRNDTGAGDPAQGHLSENQCSNDIGNQAIELLRQWGYTVVESLTQENINYLNSLPNSTEEQIRFGLNESLRLRCENSNNANADLFVAIHLNANNENTPADKKVRGSYVYAATSDEAVIGNNILMYMSNQHYDLGPDEFLDGTQRIGRPFLNKGVKDGADLYVIKNTNSSSVLVECCFVDHPNDINVYMDRAPYVNHEKTKLEEGVDYINMNIFSYNFFGYCIARGIDDYFKKTSIGDNSNNKKYMSNVSSHTPLNYACFINTDSNTSKPLIMDKGKFEEDLYGKRVFTVVGLEVDTNRNLFTRVFSTYMNFNTAQSAYGYISEMLHEDKLQYALYDDALHNKRSIYKNLAYLGNEVTVEGKTYYEFKLLRSKMVFKSDGSDYLLAQAGSTIGILKTVDLNGAYGSVVCEPTNPNYIKIHYIRRSGTKHNEFLYNVFNNDNYSWLDVNMMNCMTVEDFDLKLNI